MFKHFGMKNKNKKKNGLSYENEKNQYIENTKIYSQYKFVLKVFCFFYQVRMNQ